MKKNPYTPFIILGIILVIVTIFCITAFGFVGIFIGPTMTMAGYGFLIWVFGPNEHN